MREKKAVAHRHILHHQRRHGGREGLRTGGSARQDHPVPREITADCGLGWRTAPENREKTEALFKSLSLETDGYHICLL